MLICIVLCYLAYAHFCHLPLVDVGVRLDAKMMGCCNFSDKILYGNCNAGFFFKELTKS
jgi:hypothetical protein